MRRIGDLNNIFDNLFNKTGILRCSYFSIFEPSIEDLITEFKRCFSYYMQCNDIQFNIISFFYCILNHLTNEYLHIDITKAKQVLDDVLLFIQNKIDSFGNLNFETMSAEEIVSQKSKYFVKHIELSKEDHDIFINIIKNTESVYLPVFLKQNIIIKVSSAGSHPGGMFLENCDIKTLKEAVDNLEKHLDNSGSAEMVNLSVVTISGASDTSCGRASDLTWDRVVLGHDNGLVLVTDLSGKMTRLHGHSMTVTGVNFTSQSDQILSCSLDGTIKVWNEETCECVQTYNGHYFPVWDVTSSQLDNACFASGAMDGCVCVWDAHREKPVRKMIGHLGSVKTVEFYKSGHYLTSGGDDGQVRLWDVRVGNCVRLWEATDGSKGIEGLAFSENGNEIICGTDSGLVEWMALEGGSCVSLHLEETVSTLMCHRRHRIITGTINGGLYILEQTGPVSRECDNQFSRIINIQGQSEHGGQVLILREYEG